MLTAALTVAAHVVVLLALVGQLALIVQVLRGMRADARAQHLQGAKLQDGLQAAVRALGEEWLAEHRRLTHRLESAEARTAALESRVQAALAVSGEERRH